MLRTPLLGDPPKATKYYTIDSGIALLVAFVINLAVVCTFAKQFYDETCATASEPSACFVGESIDRSQPDYGTCGVDGMGLCQEIGLSAAAAALRGTLGSSAKYIWAIGLLVRGGEGRGWQEGEGRGEWKGRRVGGRRGGAVVTLDETCRGGEWSCSVQQQRYFFFDLFG